MPGFIVRAVAQHETGSATGFYQVVRSIGLTVGSALSAAVLMAHTRPGQALPDVSGFDVTLIIAAGFCVATAVVSFVLPGRSPQRRTAPGGPPPEELDEVMEEDAELGGAGFPVPPGRCRRAHCRQARCRRAAGRAAMTLGPPPGDDDKREAKAGRARDAVASKRALLQAAQQLFGRHGFERTTIREIGERPASTPLSSLATSGARPTSMSRRWPRRIRAVGS